jgi:hypothetical protein
MAWCGTALMRASGRQRTAIQPRPGNGSNNALWKHSRPLGVKYYAGVRCDQPIRVR